jgi:hypothetical protein
LDGCGQDGVLRSSFRRYLTLDELKNIFNIIAQNNCINGIYSDNKINLFNNKRLP